MSKQIKINDELTIHIVEDLYDSILTKDFYNNLYNNVFISEETNLKAGLIGMYGPASVKEQIETWLSSTSKYMFFLYKGKDVIGTTQAFESRSFGGDTLSLGYVVSPKVQGKGYGTVMLKFVSEYLHDLRINVVLGFRDGNVASERIAAKNNYSYLMRTSVMDVNGENRPMTFYKYNGKPIVNESYNVIPNSKMLTTNHWLDDKTHILSRVNPKMLNLEEYVYLSTSSNKPISLEETYFLFSSPHYNLDDRLKKEKINAKYFGLTDKTTKNMFDPTKKGDIILKEFCDLMDSDLQIITMNEDRTSMILGNTIGEAKVNIVNNVLMVEEFVLNK